MEKVKHRNAVGWQQRVAASSRRSAQGTQCCKTQVALGWWQSKDLQKEQVWRTGWGGNRGQVPANCFGTFLFLRVVCSQNLGLILWFPGDLPDLIPQLPSGSPSVWSGFHCIAVEGQESQGSGCVPNSGLERGVWTGALSPSPSPLLLIQFSFWSIGQMDTKFKNKERSCHFWSFLRGNVWWFSIT